MPRPKTEVADYKAVLLRMPEPWIEGCKRQAIKNHRSLNGQLLQLVELWLRATNEIMDESAPERPASKAPPDVTIDPVVLF